MALGKITFEVLRTLMSKTDHRPVSMVTVGYPDCLVPASLIGEMFGEELVPKLEYREDSNKIIRWHGLEGKLDQVVETKKLLELLGIDMTVLDINTVRGGEIICDLNEPIPEELQGRFDCVLDGGTMEHCFNVGQVIKNFVSLAKIDGYIIHSNPLSAFNHGFYNFNPTFYYDYYVDNEHRLAGPIYAVIHKGFDFEAVKLSATENIENVPNNAWLSVVAQKKHDRENVWPMQTKYKRKPGLGD